MIGLRLVVSAVLTAAALTGCVTYLLRPPTALVAVDQPRLGKVKSNDPNTTGSIQPDRRSVESEKAAMAYFETAQAILRRTPAATAPAASADEMPIIGRVLLPRKRPIPRP
jgi:hypothetical protein